MIKHRIIGKRKLLAAAVVLFVVLIGGTYLVRYYNKPRAIPTTPTGGNLTPATAQEKQESEQNKDRIVKEQSNNQQTTQDQTNKKKQVNVVITNANASAVNSYVSGVFEEGGTCTATFTQGNMSVTRTSAGFGNVSYTQCTPITPNLPNGGTWTVSVSYSSATAEGTSQTQTF